MIRVAMHNLYEDRVGEKIGYIRMYDSPHGLAIESEGLPIPRDGFHGMHIHEFGDLEPSMKPSGEPVRGGMAGQHYDPAKTGEHLGPYQQGHAGDLPKIRVKAGVWSGTVVAPRLKLKEVEDRALIIHSGGDNYSDKPMENGGGKSRIIGGVITNNCPYCDDTFNNLAKLATAGGLFYLLTRKRTE